MNKRIFLRLIPMVVLAALLAGCGPQSPVNELVSPVISAIQPITIDDTATQATPVPLTPGNTLEELPEGEQDTFRIALPENI
ncbi:MAG: hypothetical protein K8R77_10675, partial [Anaerolineaceae bacterium]|nr:hypothetical protein [Anaerolineaceae bacterium]